MKKANLALGKRIRNLRQITDLTQEQLAERAGLSLKHLGELERGRSNPTLSTLENIARALGVSLGELFDLEHERLNSSRLKAEINRIIIKETREDECKDFYRILKILIK